MGWRLDPRVVACASNPGLKLANAFGVIWAEISQRLRRYIWAEISQRLRRYIWAELANAIGVKFKITGTNDLSFLDKDCPARVDFPQMRSILSTKAVRLLLAISVSVWMAGGCLFGCSSNAMGAGLEHETADSMPTVVSGESCHAAPAHDCCAAAKKPTKKIASSAKQPKGLTSLVPVPRGMMKDCPLVVNATAATSKSSSHVPDPGREQVSALPLIANRIERSNNSLGISYLPNRGPTHLRCCVFLI